MPTGTNLPISSGLTGDATRFILTWQFSICPPVGSHIPFSGRLCMPAPSVCFWTPRLSLGHPGSFWSTHELKCMRTQTGPRFNVSSEGRGTTTRVAHPYPYGTSRAGNRTRVVVGGVPGANHYTTGPAGQAKMDATIRGCCYLVCLFVLGSKNG